MRTKIQVELSENPNVAVRMEYDDQGPRAIVSIDDPLHNVTLELSVRHEEQAKQLMASMCDAYAGLEYNHDQLDGEDLEKPLTASIERRTRDEGRRLLDKRQDS